MKSQGWAGSGLRWGLAWVRVRDWVRAGQGWIIVGLGSGWVRVDVRIKCKLRVSVRFRVRSGLVRQTIVDHLITGFGSFPWSLVGAPHTADLPNPCCMNHPELHLSQGILTKSVSTDLSGNHPAWNEYVGQTQCTFQYESGSEYQGTSTAVSNRLVWNSQVSTLD